jgi:hypothetical protein
VWNNTITYIGGNNWGGSFSGPIHTYSSNPFNINGDSSTFTTTNVNYSSINTGGINFNTASSNTFAGPNIRSAEPRLKKSKLVTMDMLSMDSIETGRVEKGGSSDQSFRTVDKTFNHYTCATSIWKILPVSQKVFEKQDLKVYCGNCGTKKRRDNHLFCPHCGEKY